MKAAGKAWSAGQRAVSPPLFIHFAGQFQRGLEEDTLGIRSDPAPRNLQSSRDMRELLKMGRILHTTVVGSSTENRPERSSSSHKLTGLAKIQNQDL